MLGLSKATYQPKCNKAITMYYILNDAAQEKCADVVWWDMHARNKVTRQIWPDVINLNTHNMLLTTDAVKGLRHVNIWTISEVCLLGDWLVYSKIPLSLQSSVQSHRYSYY